MEMEERIKQALMELYYEWTQSEHIDFNKATLKVIAAINEDQKG